MVELMIEAMALFDGYINDDVGETVVYDAKEKENNLKSITGCTVRGESFSKFYDGKPGCRKSNKWAR